MTTCPTCRGTGTATDTTLAAAYARRQAFEEARAACQRVADQRVHSLERKRGARECVAVIEALMGRDGHA